MKEGFNIESLTTLVNLVSSNGVTTVIIALFILSVLVVGGMLVTIVTITIKNNNNITNKLVASFESNQQKDREMQMLKFTETNNQLKELVCEMRNLNDKYNNTIENIGDLLQIQSQEITEAIINDKPQSLRDFDKQSKQIIISIVYKSIDYVLRKISENSLYINKERISKEILTHFQQNMQYGADLVDGLPFRDEKIKQNLFLKVEEFMMVTYMEIIKILDVDDSYKKEELEREVRDEREKFINKIQSLRYVDL